MKHSMQGLSEELDAENGVKSSVWQPIETCINPNEDQIIVSGISVLNNNDRYVCVSCGNIEFGFRSHQGLLTNQPTHWMPLPKPPED